MWVIILLYATLVLELTLKVFVGSLQEDLGEDPGLGPTLFPHQILHPH